MSKTGDNLANVIQYLAEQHPERLKRIFEVLRRRVPRIEKVLADTMPDGRLLLQIKDAPFSHPVLARFASDGTLKMLAYLVLLHDPAPPPFIGIEEPENFLHPDCFGNWPRSAVLPVNVPNYWSLLIHRFSSMPCSLKRYASSGATSKATHKRKASRI